MREQAKNERHVLFSYWPGEEVSSLFVSLGLFENGFRVTVCLHLNYAVFRNSLSIELTMYRFK